MRFEVNIAEYLTTDVAEAILRFHELAALLAWLAVGSPHHRLITILKSLVPNVIVAVVVHLMTLIPSCLIRDRIQSRLAHRAFTSAQVPWNPIALRSRCLPLGVKRYFATTASRSRIACAAGLPWGANCLSLRRGRDPFSSGSTKVTCKPG